MNTHDWDENISFEFSLIRVYVTHHTHGALHNQIDIRRIEKMMIDMATKVGAAYVGAVLLLTLTLNLIA
ncbi:MAG: hypothetical protein OEU36_12625 [Gammaproteobacteria bacterium]|nr:hypothetical protein [Gammaproteobacteria bacterium]